MNFFEQQRRAKSATRNLIMLLGLAMVLTSMSISFVSTLALPDWIQWNDLRISKWQITGSLAAIILCLIVTRSGLAYRHLKRMGGFGIATELGGQWVDPNSTIAQHRVLTNVVAEMAIAAGIPAPDSVVLPDQAINAFTAGFEIEDCVVGVTQGALDELSRDELQAVIAHEISHIVNGDAKLNTQFTGLSHGLTALGLIGRAQLRGRHGRAGLIGIAFIMVGAIGGLLARLIQAGVSRQREYLADAAAVQFTRNPAAVADALNRIRWRFSGIYRPSARKHSHIFFSDPS